MSDRSHQEDRVYLELVDASGGDFYKPVLAPLKVAIISGVDRTGAPSHKQEDTGYLDPRALRFHDLQRKAADGSAERVLTFQIVNDFDAEYIDARDGDAPYGQPEFFTSLNRTSRIMDGAGHVALWSSQSKVIDSEDERYAHALATRSPPLDAAEEADSGAATDIRMGAGAFPIPEGVNFREAGTRGAVTSFAPSVSIGGVTFFGGAAVAAAKNIIAQGGAAIDVARAASAAARNLPPPPFTPPTREREPGGGTATRPPPPDRNPDGNVLLNPHPLGYVWGEHAKRVGQLGTFFDPAGTEHTYFTGRDGTPIGPLPARHDGQFSMGPKTVGRIMFVPNDASAISEGEGKLVKGSMWFDKSRANLDTAIGGETGQWRPVLRISAKDVPPGGDPPPHQPPPWIHWDPPEDPEPREEIEDDTGVTSGSRVRTGDPTGGGVNAGGGGPQEGLGSSLDAAQGQWAAPLGGKFSPGPIHSGGVPGPGVTAKAPGQAGHQPVTPVPGGLVVGGQIDTTGFSGELTFGIPGGKVSPKPVTAGGGQRLQGGDTGFDGLDGLTFGIPGGAAPGGFEFAPQPQGRGQLTDAEARQINEARANARALQRDGLLRKEQAEIDKVNAQAKAARDAGNERLAKRLERAADKAQGKREKREQARQKREDYKQKKSDEADARRAKRKQEKEERERKREEDRRKQKEKTEKRKQKEKEENPNPPPPQGGYMIDVTDPDNPVGRGGAERGYGDLTPAEAGGILDADAQRQAQAAALYGSVADFNTFRFGDYNTATYPLKPMGATGGPSNLQGWQAAATYAINSLQTASVGAFGGGRMQLNAPINVIQEARGPGALQPSRVGAIVTAGQGEQVFCSYAPLQVVSVVEASAGGTVVAQGSGVLEVVREHRGDAAAIVDTRPGVFVTNRTGGVEVEADAYAYHVERRFAVTEKGQVVSRGLQAVVPSGTAFTTPFMVGASAQAGARNASVDKWVTVETDKVLQANYTLAVRAAPSLSTFRVTPSDAYYSIGGGQFIEESHVAMANYRPNGDATGLGYYLSYFALVEGGVVIDEISLAQVSATSLEVIDPEGGNSELIADKVTCDVMDPRVIIFDVAVATRPAELTAANWGLWVDSDTDELKFWDGATDTALGAGGPGGAADYTLNWLGW